MLKKGKVCRREEGRGGRREEREEGEWWGEVEGEGCKGRREGM